MAGSSEQAATDIESVATAYSYMPEAEHLARPPRYRVRAQREKHALRRRKCAVVNSIWEWVWGMGRVSREDVGGGGDHVWPAKCTPSCT